MKPQNVIIIGGGVIGLSLTWELSRRGVQVTLLDKADFGQATSWAAAGILPPANRHTATDPMDQLRGLSHELFPMWCQQLQEVTGIDCGLRHCGGWYLAETAGEQAAMIGMTQYWQELQIECEPIELRHVPAREPLLTDWCQTSNQHKAAWWAPDEYQLRTPRFLQALVSACRAAGADLREHQNVTKIRLHNDSAGIQDDGQVNGQVGVQVDGRWIDTEAIVVCGGAWTGLLDPQLRLQNSIVPIRGQILLLKTDQPHLNTVVNVGNRYLIGRDDGHVLVGSCEEEVGFRKGTSDAMLRSLRQFADRIGPALRGAETVTAWFGFRPMTFDGFPMIGRVPGQDHVYVAAGHYRSGVHLAPATAVTLADTLLGSAPEVDLTPFRVGKQQT
tara:strand:+ start:118841 stop:120004 length:1164 start_codon:yes stop_codon:yes gene_type:complete